MLNDIPEWYVAGYFIDGGLVCVACAEAYDINHDPSEIMPLYVFDVLSTDVCDTCCRTIDDVMHDDDI